MEPPAVVVEFAAVLDFVVLSLLEKVTLATVIVRLPVFFLALRKQSGRRITSVIRMKEQYAEDASISSYIEQSEGICVARQCNKVWRKG